MLPNCRISIRLINHTHSSLLRQIFGNISAYQNRFNGFERNLKYVVGKVVLPSLSLINQKWSLGIQGGIQKFQDFIKKQKNGFRLQTF